MSSSRSRTRSIDAAYSEAVVLRGLKIETAPVVVAGRYELLRRIGRGGFGTVYEAADQELGREVALKVLDLGDPDVARREGQLLAKLEHPNIVKIYDHGTAEDYRYYVLQLLRGPTLREWCVDKTPEQIVEAYEQAGRGLLAAHQAGLVHRDFKPSNVRIGPKGEAVVVDFGLARHLETLDRGPEERSYLAGTLAYAAPECLVGRAGDERSDQFSFCVALWEALSGENPFGRAGSKTTPEDRYKAILGQIRGTPRGKWRVRQAVRKGLSIFPRDRWPTMRELLAALRPQRKTLRWVDLALGSVVLVAVGLLLARFVPTGSATRPVFVEGALIAHVGHKAVEHAKAGEHAQAIWVLENAQWRVEDPSQMLALAGVCQKVAEELERHGNIDDAVVAWGLAIRLARDGDDEALAELGHQRMYNVAAKKAAPGG